MYWDKNFAKFNFANYASYLPESCGWNSRIAMCICACTHECVKIFTMQKKFTEKNLPTACIGEIGENFLLAKISAYTVYVRSIVIHIVGHCLVTKIFIGKLPTTRGVWVIIG